jgi:hypothetical protein
VSFVIFSSCACDSYRCHQHDPAVASEPAGLRGREQSTALA